MEAAGCEASPANASPSHVLQFIMGIPRNSQANWDIKSLRHVLGLPPWSPPSWHPGGILFLEALKTSDGFFLRAGAVILLLIWAPFCLRRHHFWKIGSDEGGKLKRFIHHLPGSRYKRNLARRCDSGTPPRFPLVLIKTHWKGFLCWSFILKDLGRFTLEGRHNPSDSKRSGSMCLKIWHALC